MICHNPKRRISVNQISLLVNKQRAVGVAVKRHADFGVFFQNLFLQIFQMKRAAVFIDIFTVRRVIDDYNLRA